MAWNVSKLKLSRSKTLDGPAGSLLGMAFGSSGAKMYCIEMLNSVREYDLSVNYDPFSETYVQKIDLSADAMFLADVSFNTAGTKMYVISISASEIHEYDLGAAWDISTAVHLQDMSVSPNNTPGGMRFKPDGTMLYITSAINEVVGYSLSTAWDISTMLETQQVGLPECAAIHEQGIDFKSDGTKMYVVCASSHRILEYSLAKAWDITTARYLRSSGCSVAGGSIMFDSYGNIVYSGVMYEYTLPIGKHRAVKSS